MAQRIRIIIDSSANELHRKTRFAAVTMRAGPTAHISSTTGPCAKRMLRAHESQRARFKFLLISAHNSVVLSIPFFF